jgi:VWFA-related protein
MAGVTGAGGRCGVVGLVLWIAAFAVGVSASAQDAAAKKDEPVTTLHVYANTIQIPVLVLGPRGQRITKLIARERFEVNVDSGPWFRATHVRLEGDDPISLTILLDASGVDAHLMKKMDAAIAGLAEGALRPQDHVSVYALDCSLVRSLDDTPANGAVLRDAVERALEMSSRRRAENKARVCKPKVNLWDALGYTAKRLGELPGRRVLLAVSDGEDRGSVTQWNQVQKFAEAKGVAVFGLTRISEGYTGLTRESVEDPFRSICELSGGTVLFTEESALSASLRRFAEMVRERYIVEFPRPYNSTAGAHELEVKVDRGNDLFVRASGVSVPILDPALLADPSTVRSDPSRAPQQGTRRILDPQP